MMSTALKYLIYFILGGSIVAVATYFGSEKKGLISAFFALFPFITTFILFTVYSEAGLDAAASYTKGLLMLIPILILYLVCILYLLPRYGFWVAITSGIIIYTILALIIVLRF